MLNALEPQHGSHSWFDSAVVLFNHVVYIFACSHRERSGQEVFFLKCCHRFMRGGIPVQGDLLRDATLLDCPRKEALGRSDIAGFAQEKVDRLPAAVYRTIQVDSLAFHFQPPLIDSPGGPTRARVPLPTFGKLWNRALHPAHDGGLRHVYGALRHACHQVPVVQLLREVPADTDDEDGAVTVTARK